MDACFAMFKQPFFSFSYRLEDLVRYYPAYRKLIDHWRSTIGDRMIEVSYEAFVSNQEKQSRLLIDKLGLSFENGCLDFHKNSGPVSTASSVQVREQVHSRSVEKWKYYAEQLEPLRGGLEKAGVAIE